jgi:REP element-mobilizing transposase RayT
MNNRNPFRPEPEIEQGAAEQPGSAGVPPVTFARYDPLIGIRKRRLPHWEAIGAVYFVTFRLADSLPHKALRRIEFIRKDILATAVQMNREISENERRRLNQLHARKIEKYLDSGAGSCSLRSPAVAEIVANALRQFNGTRYQLFAWCVMPNHVHVVFQTLVGNTLARILHSWKSYTAKQANQILNRSAEFWQREYYDRLVRDTAEFHRAVQYVIDNPKRAGLKNWPWVWPKQ